MSAKMISSRFTQRGPLLLVLVLLGFIPQHAQSPLSPTEILRETERVYSSCSSYQDSGCVSIRFLGEDEEDIGIEFVTAFVRPNQFKFESRTLSGAPKGKHYVISKNGQDVRRLPALSSRSGKQMTLERAVVVTSSVTGGAAQAIPALLMPLEIPTSPFSGLKDCTRRQDETLDSRRFYVIEGKRAHSTVKLWIERGSYLIWKIERLVTVHGVRSRQTTTYLPKVNSKINVTFLQFAGR